MNSYTSLRAARGISQQLNFSEEAKKRASELSLFGMAPFQVIYVLIWENYMETTFFFEEIYDL